MCIRYSIQECDVVLTEITEFARVDKMELLRDKKELLLMEPLEL